MQSQSDLLRGIDAFFDRHDCSNGLYLDVGTNRGVQLRKLYEPELFLAKNTRDQSIPQAMLAGFMHEMRATMQLMNESFGPTPRCGVCAIGVEPNPSHYDHLKQVTRNLRAMGYAAYVVFAAASTAAGTAQLGNRDQSRFAGGLNSPSLGLAANILPSRGSTKEHTHAGAAKNATTVTVPTIDLAHLMRHLLRRLDRHRDSTLARPTSLPVVMKMDVEGVEYELLPHLLKAEGSPLCRVRHLIYEFHPENVGMNVSEGFALEERFKTDVAAACKGHCPMIRLDDEYGRFGYQPWPRLGTRFCRRREDL